MRHGMKAAYLTMVTNILTAVVTAYVATGQPTASNKMPVVGVTVALPRRFPLGSVVVIDGVTRIGEDRTNKRFDDRFDIFVATRHTALEWGKQVKTVTVITN